MKTTTNTSTPLAVVDRIGRFLLRLVMFGIASYEVAFAQVKPFSAVDQPVGGLAFLPNSNDFVASNWSGEILGFKMTGDSISVSARANAETEWSIAAAIAPDGRRLLTGKSDGTIAVWNPSSLASLGTLKHHSNWVTCVDFSPNGRFFASGSRDRLVIVWDCVDSSVRWKLGGHQRWVECVAFSPDGQKLASGDWQGMVFVWDINTGAIVSAIRAADHGAVMCLAFSPDGKILFSGDQDNAIRLWDTKDWAKRGEIKAHTATVRAIIPWGDGRTIITASQDHTIRVFDAIALCQIAIIGTHEGNWVMRLALSSDRKTLASGDFDGRIKFWNLAAFPRATEREMIVR